jgi:cytochrome P450
MKPACPVFSLPFDKEYTGLDPVPEQAGLADGEPLLRVRLPYGGEGWLARRHEDVKAVLSDPRFSRAEAIGRDIPRLVPDIDRDDYPNPLKMDPPDHTRLRTLGTNAFSARRISQLAPYVQQVVDDLLEGMIGAGPSADFMDHFAWPLPITVICQILGVPVVDRARFNAWADATMMVKDFEPEEVVRAWGVCGATSGPWSSSAARNRPTTSSASW